MRRRPWSSASDFNATVVRLLTEWGVHWALQEGFTDLGPHPIRFLLPAHFVELRPAQIGVVAHPIDDVIEPLPFERCVAELGSVFFCEWRSGKPYEAFDSTAHPRFGDPQTIRALVASVEKSLDRLLN